MVGTFPEGNGQTKYAVVAIDYFTKCAEAEALARIKSFQIQTFVWKNIIYRFGLPRVIISNNGTQFDCKSFEELYEGHGIEIKFSSPVYSQAKGQVEVTNRTLLSSLKKRLDDAKGNWAEELASGLSAYRTSIEVPLEKQNSPSLLAHKQSFELKWESNPTGLHTMTLSKIM